LYRSNPGGQDLKQVPISIAVPFPQGELHDAQPLALVDSAGQPLPFDSQVTSRWWGLDNSIQTLLLTFLVDTDQPYVRLLYGSDARGKQSQATPQLQVTEDANTVEVNTGKLRARLSKDSFRLFEELSVDLNGNGLFTRDEKIIEAQGKSGLRAGSGSSSGGPCHVVVEDHGPIRGVVRVEGKYDGPKDVQLDYQVRLYFYAGQSFVVIEHTFIQNTGEVFADIPFLSLDLPITRTDGKVTFGLENRRPLSLSTHTGGCSLLQTGPEPAEQIKGLDEYEEFQEIYKQRKPYQSAEETRLWNTDERQVEFICEISRDGEVLSTADRAAGWVQFAPYRADWGITAQMRYFPDLHPKQISLDEQGLTFYLYPAALDKPLHLHVGTAKMHTLVLAFGRQEHLAQQLQYTQAITRPVKYFPTPQWFCDSKVWGDIIPRQPGKFQLFEDMAVRKITNDFITARKPENRVCSGMMNFGDIPQGPNWWGNMETAYVHALFIQFIRTGGRQYYDFFEQAARHFRDIDINHADFRGWDYGMWLMPGYVPESLAKECAQNEQLRDEVFYYLGEAHNPPKGGIRRHSYRHYGNAGQHPTPDRDPYTPWKRRKCYAGTCAIGGHGWFVGLVDHYLLTGDQRSLEIAKMCGEHILSREQHVGWGRDNWRNVDLMALYRATGDERCLRHVRQAIEGLYNQREKVIEGLKNQKESLMSPYYTILQFVRRYHRCTGDPQVAKMYMEMIDPWIDHMIWAESRLGPVFYYIRDFLDSRCSTDFADLAYAYKLTGDRSYVDRALSSYELYVPIVSDSTFLFAGPEYLYALDQLGIKALDDPKPQLWYVHDAYFRHTGDQPVRVMVFQWSGYRVPAEQTEGVVRLTKPSGQTIEHKITTTGLDVHRFNIPASSEPGIYRIHAEGDGLYFNMGASRPLRKGIPSQQ